MEEVLAMTMKYHSRKIAQRGPQGNIFKIHDSVKDAAYWSGGAFTSKQLYNHLYHSEGALWHGYYWEWYESGEGVVERECLDVGCGRKFISKGPHNRFCPRCRRGGDSNPLTYKVHGEGKKT